MTLRIFEQEGEREHVVALHGWLSTAEVSELERVAAVHGPPLEIDLENLAGVDLDGLHALVRLQEAGARLTRASPFVALLLQRTVQEGAETARTTAEE